MSHSPVAPATLVDLLAQQATADPSRVIYTVLSNDGEPSHLRCDALWQQAQNLASALQAVTTAGDRVMLLYPTGLPFVVALFGSMAAGLIPVPAPPIAPHRRARTLPRLLAMVRDAKPSLVLHAPSLRNGRDALRAETPDLGALRWRTIEELAPDDASADAWSPPALGGDSLAYLQYTSGSTASPKGVMVRHDNLLHNARVIKDAWRYDHDSVDVSWVPNFHDDGIVHAILEPLYCGGRSILMEPAAFIGRPARWLEAITQYRGTHSGGPDFAYALTARKVGEAQRQGLDLSSWRLAYNAAEPVRHQTLDAFIEAFAPHGFAPEALFPSFGLAEATLLVTTAAWDRRPTYFDVDPSVFETHGRAIGAAKGAAKEARRLVGCGEPVVDTEMVIADPQSCTRLSADQVGEVWIRSGSVAAGYWQRPEATAYTFGGRLSGSNDDVNDDEGADEGPGAGYLRTGDLGFLHEGELFVTGRIKDLIIVRGRNVYPQDIEQEVAACHPALRPGCGAAFGVERGGVERLVIVQEAGEHPSLDIDAVVRDVRQRLAASHDLQLETLVLIQPRTIAKTSSGKIQRHACKLAFLAGSLDEVCRWPGPPEASDMPAKPTGDDADTQPVDALLTWLRRFAGSIDWHQADARRAMPPNVVLQLGRRGLLGMQASPEEGGLDLSNRDVGRVLIQLGAIDLTLATFVTGHNALGLRPIQRHATTRMRQRLVPHLAQGYGLAAFALSESGAGSNPRALTATAVPDGKGWRLYGEKRWIGSAGWATVINVFVQRLDDQGQQCGIVGFAVPTNAEGLRIGNEARTLGLRGMTQNTISLEGVRVSAKEVLGAPGEGMLVAEDAMRFTRFCLAAISVGGTKRCLQLMLRYASRRTIATGRLLDNPVTLARMTDAVHEVTAVEALVQATADALDAQATVPDEIFAVLKIAGPELLWRTADRLVQLLGGRGYEENNIAPRILRDARVFRIFEGPTEALQMWLGASVEHDPQALDTFLRRLGAVAAADSLQSAVSTVIQHLASQPTSPTDRVASRQWIHAQLGEITTAAVVWGAVEAADGQNERAAARRSQRRFGHLVAQATATTNEATDHLDPAGATDAITRFEVDIGNTHEAPSAPPLDALLVREPNDPPTEAATRIATPVPRTKSAVGPAGEQAAEQAAEQGATAERTAAIAAWLVAWCSRELGVEVGLIDVNQNFVNIGLTSVTAVSLADQLGEWLERSLERTLVWQYPTINAIARHFGGDLPATPETSTTTVTSTTASDTASDTASTTASDAAEPDLLRLLLDDVEQLSDEQAKSTLRTRAIQQGTDDGSS